MFKKLCKLLGIRRPPTKCGLEVYRTLYALERHCRNMKNPNRLNELLADHHEALNALRKDLGRDLPDEDQIVALGGPGGGK